MKVYYDNGEPEPVTIIDLGPFYIFILDFAEWVADKEDKYHFTTANYTKVNKKFNMPSSAVEITNNKMWISLYNKNKKFLQHKILTLIFE